MKSRVCGCFDTVNAMDELPEHLVSVARKPGYNLERDAYVFRGALPAIGDVISVTARFGNVPTRSGCA